MYTMVSEILLQYWCKFITLFLEYQSEGRWRRGEDGYRQGPSRERAEGRAPGMVTKHWALRCAVKEGQQGIPMSHSGKTDAHLRIPSARL